MKRKWTSIRKFEPQIIRMRNEGYTRQQIADALGLEKEQIKGWIRRYNHHQKTIPQILKRRGRPRKRPICEVEAMALYIRKLEREVELYRSFLQAAGRM